MRLHLVHTDTNVLFDNVHLLNPSSLYRCRGNICAWREEDIVCSLFCCCWPQQSLPPSWSAPLIDKSGDIISYFFSLIATKSGRITKTNYSISQYFTCGTVAKKLQKQRSPAIRLHMLSFCTKMLLIHFNGEVHLVLVAVPQGSPAKWRRKMVEMVQLCTRAHTFCLSLTIECGVFWYMMLYTKHHTSTNIELCVVLIEGKSLCEYGLVLFGIFPRSTPQTDTKKGKMVCCSLQFLTTVTQTRGSIVTTGSTT